MDVIVGHPPDPYRIDVAYAMGTLIGKVEEEEGEEGEVAMDEPDPDPDHLGRYIRQALRERFTLAPQSLELMRC